MKNSFQRLNLEKFLLFLRQFPIFHQFILMKRSPAQQHFKLLGGHAYFTTPMAFICAGMDMVAMPLV